MKKRWTKTGWLADPSRPKSPLGKGYWDQIEVLGVFTTRPDALACAETEEPPVRVRVTVEVIP